MVQEAVSSGLALQLLKQLVDRQERANELLQAIVDRLGQESQSSVLLNTSARGTDISVKVYPNSDVVQAGNAALDEYLRLRSEIEQRLMDGFTKEAAKRGVG